MAKRFFVWADANCNGQNIEWIELTGKEFYLFISDPINKGRHIIKLTDTCFYEDDDIYIEATKEEYIKWEKEYKHSLYINRMGREINVYSIQELLEIDETFDIPYFDEAFEDIFDSSITDMFSVIDALPVKYRSLMYIKYESYLTGDLISNLCKKYNVSERTYYRNTPMLLKHIKEKFSEQF